MDARGGREVLSRKEELMKRTLLARRPVGGGECEQAAAVEKIPAFSRAPHTLRAEFTQTVVGQGRQRAPQTSSGTMLISRRQVAWQISPTNSSWLAMARKCGCTIPIYAK